MSYFSGARLRQIREARRLTIDDVHPRTDLTFDEAVRLCVAAFDDADWERVGDEINRRDRLDPSLFLESTYGAVIARTRDLLG